MDRHPEYRFTIGNTENRWIFVEDTCDSGWERAIFDWLSDIREILARRNCC